MRARVVIFGFIVAMAPAFAQAELADCSCTDFDKLQQELENAVTLRDRHQAKADEMERRLKAGESMDHLKAEYKSWEEDTSKGAGAGIVATVPGQSVAIQYVSLGDKITLEGWSSPVTKDGYTTNQYDAKKAHDVEENFRKNNKGKDLCDFSEPEKISQGAEKTGFCKAVRDIIIAHEENHRKTCLNMGYVAFFLRSPVEIARDEVNAYNKQIEALEKEIGKALKGAEAQFESSSTMSFSAQVVNFQFSHTVPPIKGKIPDNDGKTWSVNLKGTHKSVADKILMAGMSCSMPSFTRDIDLSVAASGKQTTITFNSFGPQPKITMKCPNGGHGSSLGGGSDRSGESFVMPLKLSSSHSEDAAKSKIADMLRGAMKVSGTIQSKLTIICPPAKP
jgi:hypothetical protein